MTTRSPADPDLSPTPAAPDAHDVITVVGARENNLRGVDVTIPKRRLTNETYSSFIQGFMPSTAHPDVDRLEGLTPALLVDQERLGANTRSTLGTASDVNGALRVLFSRLSTP